MLAQKSTCSSKKIYYIAKFLKLKCFLEKEFETYFSQQIIETLKSTRKLPTGYVQIFIELEKLQQDLT